MASVAVVLVTRGWQVVGLPAEDVKKWEYAVAQQVTEGDPFEHALMVIDEIDEAGALGPMRSLHECQLHMCLAGIAMAGWVITSRCH